MKILSLDKIKLNFHRKKNLLINLKEIIGQFYLYKKEKSMSINKKKDLMKNSKLSLNQ